MAVAPPGLVDRPRPWLRPPRRLRLLRSGGLLLGGILGLGFATLNTGNNLLYLLLGALLGLIVLSGILSEQNLRRVAVHRMVPRAVTAGESVAMQYRLKNGRRQLPSYALTVREGAGGAAFLLSLPPQSERIARARTTFPHRGAHVLGDLTLATTFPFGLFEKERVLTAHDVVLVRPRTTRRVRELRAAGREGARMPVAATPAAGAERGEFRGLRAYRPGDDPRDVHWLSSARTNEPIVREYDREHGRSYTLYLDTRSAPGAAAEVAVEMVAALAAAAIARGDRFALNAGSEQVSAGSGPAQLDRVLDALARVSFPAVPASMADPRESVWIGTAPPPAGYLDAFVAGADG
jgi:uncharacterized protein (DUF58 family)